MTQGEIWRVIREFLGSSDQILVTPGSSCFDEIGCTPSSVSLIINYDLPFSKESYQKNFGVLKRFTKNQTATNFVMPYDLKRLLDIESFYSIKMQIVPKDLNF